VYGYPNANYVYPSSAAAAAGRVPPQSGMAFV
jgi:hypothetical protein